MSSRLDLLMVILLSTRKCSSINIINTHSYRIGFLNIKNTNLNLLRSLNALLTEQNVSRAGASVGISQSAMSIVLKQLRAVYHDDLLVRSTRGRMQLTKLAKKLATQAKDALLRSEAVLAEFTEFNPVTSEKTFHIGMSTPVAGTLLPKLIQRVARTAPYITIIQHEIDEADSALLLDRMDMIIGEFHTVPIHLKSSLLYHDRDVLVADKQHPIFSSGKVSLNNWLSYPQISTIQESTSTRLITTQILTAMQALQNSRLIATMPEKLSRPFLEIFGLGMANTPFKPKSYRAKLYWHARDHTDKANVWLRDMVKYIAKKQL